MTKYLLIDGQNLAIRSAFANKNLRDHNGVFTGIHYGFFKSLVSLKKRFNNYLFIIFWDGKSKKRMQLSLENVEKKIIKSVYKANREKNKKDEKFIDFHKQLPTLKEAVRHTGIQQVFFQDYEADDVIASYCKLLRDDNEIITSTSDHDFYQTLHNNVSIWDGLHLKLITKQDFENEYEITPEEFIDFGALMGDVGDNIHGIPSWGDKTALEEIQKHKSYKNVLDCYIKQYGHLENSFSKIESMLDLEDLRLRATKSGKKKYPDVYYGMPFSGVALAIEQKKIKPIPQKALLLLMYQERLDLAYKLKKMDDEIDDLPEIKEELPCLDKLYEYFERYSIKSLSQDMNIFLDKKEDISVVPVVEVVEKPEEELEEKSILFDF